MHSIGEKLRNRDDQYAACEASRRLLCTEVDTMKAVHHKLSNDLQVLLAINLCWALPLNGEITSKMLLSFVFSVEGILHKMCME